MKTAFDTYVESQMKNPEFASAYQAAQSEISEIMNCSKCNVGIIQKTSWVNDDNSTTTVYGCNKCIHEWVEQVKSSIAEIAKSYIKEHQCLGVVPGTFIVCGEDNYQYCSSACMEIAKYSKELKEKYETRESKLKQLGFEDLTEDQLANIQLGRNLT